MKLMEKEKQRQFELMDSRVRKLEIDKQRAEKQLKQTMETHQKVEQVNKRKKDDEDFKNKWIQEQNEKLLT